MSITLQAALDNLNVKSSLSESTTVNFDSSMTATQIQTLIDAQSRDLTSHQLIFQFADGTYTLDSKLSFKGFMNGIVYIKGNTTSESAGTLHTDQAVHLNFSASNCSGIQSLYNSAMIYYRCLKVTVDTSSSDNYCIYDLYGIRAVHEGCCFLGTSTSYGTGSMIGGQFSTVHHCYYSNMLRGIRGVNASIIDSQYNDDTGTAPAYGLFIANGGVIGKSGTQPSGSTASEHSENGGVIR